MAWNESLLFSQISVNYISTNANEWTFNFCTFALIVCECFNYNSMQNIAEKRTQTEKNVLCPSVNSPMQLKSNSTEWEKKPTNRTEMKILFLMKKLWFENEIRQLYVFCWDSCKMCATFDLLLIVIIVVFIVFRLVSVFLQKANFFFCDFM